VNKSLNIQSLTQNLLWFFLLISISFPSVFFVTKLTLLVLAVIFTGIKILKKRSKIAKLKIIFVLLTFSLLIFSSINGVKAGYIFTSAPFKAYFLNLALLVFFACFSIQSFEKFNSSLMKYSILLICIPLTIYSIFMFLKIEFIFDMGHVFGGVNTNEASLQVRGIGQSTLIMVFPIWLSYVLSRASEKNLLNLIIIFLVTFIVAISGRRALQIAYLAIALITVLIILLPKFNGHATLNKKSFYLSLISVSALFILLYYIDLQVFDRIKYSFMDGFNPKSKSAGLKLDQLSALIQSWSEKPFWGHGLNAYSLYFQRSQVQPFVYELTYHAMLVQIGIIGTLSFATLILFILWRYNSILKYRYKVIAVSGLLIFVVLGGTNPMIFFNWIWVYFGLILGADDNE
jgi:hypothetical protein